MTLLKRHWEALGAALLIASILALGIIDARAADKAGTGCCVDLEERIAELEATAALKGNRKVTLNISGQVNKAVIYWDHPGGSDTAVIEGGASESTVKFNGKAVIRPGWEAGFALEIGQGITGLEASGEIAVDNDTYLRQSYVFLKTEAGKISIGKQEMATYGVSTIQLGGTDASTRLLTIQPITTVAGFNAELFNGYRADAVRYDSPSFGGFGFAASWASGDEAKDVALQYAGDVLGFRIEAGVGYLKLEQDGVLALGDVEKFLGSVAIQHTATGLFLNAAAARLETDLFDTDAYHVQAGIAAKLIDAGATSVFVEYADWSDVDLSFYGAGVNQALGGSIDAYLTARQYDLASEDATTITGGLRVKF